MVALDEATVRKNASYRGLHEDYGVWEIPGLFAVLPSDPMAAFSILEIGCGYGHSSGAIRARYPMARVVAADIVDECLERTRERYPGVEAIRLDADRPLPVEDASFDFVFSSNLFEHLHDDASHLREVRRILVPGGAYVVSTPNLLVELLYYGVLLPEQGTRWRSIHARLTHDRRIQHCNLQTVGTLSRRLQQAGFRARVQPRGELSNTERRKLGGLIRSERLLAWAEKLWCALPPSLGPSLVVVGTKT